MNEEMRKEFEEWCVSHGFTLRPAQTNCGIVIDGEYGNQRVQIAWQAWQASRQAMRPIKLPMWCMTSDGPSKYLLQYEVIEAIQQAGYKVEG